MNELLFGLVQVIVFGLETEAEMNELTHNGPGSIMNEQEQLTSLPSVLIGKF